MNAQLSRQTAARLRLLPPSALTAAVGLDAFVDEIIRVVGRRASATDWSPLEKITELGQRIVGAAGQSTNLELVVERVKLGGNGPIMANALAGLGADVTCIGPFGAGDTVHPAFAELAARTSAISLGPPAHTDALEFEDGKVMLGKLEPLLDITWDRLVERVGEPELTRLVSQSALVALVNWTMLPFMSQIWESALSLLASLPAKPEHTRFFFDLADPEKIADGPVADACRLLSRFSEFGAVTLGLNEKEAFRVGTSLGYAGGQFGRDDVRAVAAFVSRTLPIEQVVVHPRAYAVVAAGGEITADVDGPFTDAPRISTGAGDHFNAGFCFAKCQQFSDAEAATAAVGVSGFYVREAAGPTAAQLADFLDAQADAAQSAV